MKIRMKPLCLSDGRDVYDMLQEIGLGENGFTTNFAEHNFEQFKDSLPRLVEISNGINLADGFVPQTIYWMYVNDQPVAYGKLRHRLTDQLMKYGGHIGYIIRPSERGKGYGKLFLHELKKEARTLGLDRLLLTCNEDNLRSRKVIEGNDGFIDTIQDGICRYWIQL